jgi:hypothetical protein
MTLVIAEISKFGVVMAADTAETRTVIAQSGATYTRVKFGTPKLFPIKPLNGGVAFWGAGEIYDATQPSSRIPTDVWLEDLVAKEKFAKLEEFAFTLRKNLNVLLGHEAAALGFFVAGVGKTAPADGQPVFYRISNRDTHGGVRPEFEVDREDLFPNLQDRPEVRADGDARLYFDLLDRVNAGEPLKTTLGPIPFPSLPGRAEYQASWVRFVSDLYQSAGLSRTIGGKITVLRVGLGVDQFDYEES